MERTRRRLAVVVLVLLTVTAGCTGGTGSAPGDDSNLAGSEADFAGQRGGDGGPSRTPAAEATAADLGDGGDSEYSAAQFAERQLILTGRLELEVEDFEAARANLTDIVERRGGFVSDTRQRVNRRGNETWTVGTVVLRVPRDDFTATFEEARAEGTLLEENRESQDVTDQLVDLRARLDNLRAERDQLRQLYERANDTEAVLQVQERLSEVQGEIERLEARQQSLQQRVAMSTITVELSEPRPDRPLPDEWYDVGLLTAFLESVDGVVVTLRAISVAAAYAVPYLVVFGVPLAAAGYVARQRRGPRPPGRLRRRLSRGRGDEPAVEEPAADERGEAVEEADREPGEEVDAADEDGAGGDGSDADGPGGDDSDGGSGDEAS